ncbi:MAG: sugar ABC transporter substrate-binding protein [Chloroflexi bacterium]|nr:sugar ABC transporter substrate-binding protein [Chloroflexota bacterium]
MKSRSLFLISVLTVLALLLTACGGAAATQAPSTEDTAVANEGSSSTPVTLNVIIEQVPDYDIVNELTQEFNANNPDIQVVFDAMTYDAMRDKILTSFLAPKGTYDIIIVDNPWMDEFPDAGFLTDLTDYIKNTPDYDFEDYAAPIRDLTTHDGVITAVPYYNYALGLIVRQDLFDDPDLQSKFEAEYGRPLAAPTTLDEYLEVGKFFQANGIAGAAMQPQRGYKILEEWKNWLYAEGGDIMDDAGNPIVNSDAAKTALEKYIEMYKTAAPENSLNWGFDDAMRSMAAGESATMLSYNWMLPTLNNPSGSAGDLAGKFALYPVPGGKAVLGAWYWAIPKNSNNPDAAWKYISWLTSKQIDKRRVIMGGAPTRTSVLNDSEVWEQGYGKDYYTTVLEILNNCEPLARGIHADEISNEVGTYLNSAVAGEMSVEDALKGMEDKINEINAAQ